MAKFKRDGKSVWLATGLVPEGYKDYKILGDKKVVFKMPDGKRVSREGVRVNENESFDSAQDESVEV